MFKVIHLPIFDEAYFNNKIWHKNGTVTILFYIITVVLHNNIPTGLN